MRPKRPTPHPLLAYMSYPSRHEAVAIAIAAIGVGMFIGTWVIGPAIPQGNIERAAETTGAPSFEEMVSRPDPDPYRSATPQFDMSGAPKYGEAARQAALEDVHPVTTPTPRSRRKAFRAGPDVFGGSIGIPAHTSRASSRPFSFDDGVNLRAKQHGDGRQPHPHHNPIAAPSARSVPR